MYQPDCISGPSPDLEMVNVAPLVESYVTAPVDLNASDALVKSKVLSDSPNAVSAGHAGGC
jgi:hypothetical protein